MRILGVKIRQCVDENLGNQSRIDAQSCYVISDELLAILIIRPEGAGVAVGMLRGVGDSLT